MLADLDLEHTAWQVPASYDDGPMLHEATLASRGWRGSSASGWSRATCPASAVEALAEVRPPPPRHYVVGGWRPQEGTTDRLAALLVGEVTAEGLMYRGRVGSGIAGRGQPVSWPTLLAPHRAATPARSPTRCRASTPAARTWVEPVLVVDVDTHGLGYERLRQPSYRGLRTDVGVEDLLMPEKQEVYVDVEGRTLKISSLDKVLYPRTGTTKGEVLSYYARIAPVMLPHLKDRAGDPDPVAARGAGHELLREERPRRARRRGCAR